MQRWSGLGVLALAAGLWGGARPAAAQTITFDALETAGNSVYLPGGLFTENGLRLVNPGVATWGAPNTGHPANNYYAGSAGVFNDTPGSLFILDRLDGQLFTLNRIDIAEIWNHDAGSSNQTTVRYTGFKADSSTVEQTFTTDGIQRFKQTGIRGYETFTFNPVFSDLQRVEWRVISTQRTDLWAQFDQIVTNAAPAGEAVPEPGAILLFLPALGVVTLLRRSHGRFAARADTQ